LPRASGGKTFDAQMIRSIRAFCRQHVPVEAEGLTNAN
jgi:hypothetical protein